MRERGEGGGFTEVKLSKQDIAPVTGYGVGIPSLEQQNQPEAEKPQKVKIPRRTRGKGRFIRPKKV